MRRPLLVLVALSALSACNREGDPTIPETLLGTCTYVNRFSDAQECREYRGVEWGEEAARADCSDWGGSLEMPGACEYPSILGACVLTEGAEQVIRVVVPGEDPSKCRSAERGCELFGGGIFVPSPLCGGADDYINEDESVFQPPVLECRDPIEGEPPGQSEGGKVCTWSMISGSTEEGRHFNDYASCERVLTQRPYAAVPPPAPPVDPDPRMDDPTYVAELEWVKTQVEASACVCCHQTSITPEGASVWDIDAPGNWVNTFSPYGLAFAGGFLDSSLLGAYPPEENNGFDRDHTGIPTTDPDRLIAFFAAELAFRGFTPDDWADADPTPAPFYQQSIYVPGACEEGEGVAADGSVSWSGGGARYVYVLEAGSENPMVPPNLDRPAGTLWKLDVAPESSPLRSGELRYGEVPEGSAQALPLEGAPPALVDGRDYYLYVSADVMIPITRCTFTYRG
ncbi:MAG: hypothetical protein H6710_07215 [Myxococcales bacterium]|nr:hypothetical protein [Myxococcales bacterium]